MMHKDWCIVEEVPYNFSMSSIKFQGHMGWKIGNSNRIWVRLPGRSQISNPPDLPCLHINAKINLNWIYATLMPDRRFVDAVSFPVWYMELIEIVSVKLKTLLALFIVKLTLYSSYCSHCAYLYLFEFYSSYSFIMLPYSSFENDFASFRKPRVWVKIYIIVVVIVSISRDWSELSSITKVLQLAGRGFQVITLHTTLGLYSLSRKTSYRQISWSLEAVRLDVIMIASLWNLTGISAALLPRCLWTFRAIGEV